MRVLVTGGCGFVGSAVVRLAVERGDHVLNLDRRKKSVAIPSLGAAVQREGYARLEADITDRAMIKAILREFSPDAVIHLAACGDDDPVLSEAAATAIELLHCASLVHDDLPCFDDATTRRPVQLSQNDASAGDRFGKLLGLRDPILSCHRIQDQQAGMGQPALCHGFLGAAERRKDQGRLRSPWLHDRSRTPESLRRTNCLRRHERCGDPADRTLDPTPASDGA